MYLKISLLAGSSALSVACAVIVHDKVLLSSFSEESKHFQYHMKPFLYKKWRLHFIKKNRASGFYKTVGDK